MAGGAAQGLRLHRIFTRQVYEMTRILEALSMIVLIALALLIGSAAALAIWNQRRGPEIEPRERVEPHL